MRAVAKSLVIRRQRGLLLALLVLGIILLCYEALRLSRRLSSHSRKSIALQKASTVTQRPANNISSVVRLSVDSFPPLQDPNQTSRYKYFSFSDKRSLRCYAASRRQPSAEISDLYFKKRLRAHDDYLASQSSKHRTLLDSAAFLTGETAVVPELSRSPLVSYQNVFFMETQYAAREAAQRNDGTARKEFVHFLASQRKYLQRFFSDASPRDCHKRAAVDRSNGLGGVIVVTSARDEPKRALEFVAHHLVLGAEKVVIVDVGTDQLVRRTVDDDVRYGAEFGGRVKRRGLRHAPPPLSSYLRLFVEAGLVEVVMAAELDNALNATTPPDLFQARALSSAFFRAETRKIASVGLAGHVLVTRDVSDFVVITVKPRRKSTDPICLPDLFNRTAVAEAKHYARGGLLLPKVLVRPPNFLFDDGRLLFEHSHFSVGNKMQVYRNVVDLVGKKALSRTTALLDIFEVSFAAPRDAFLSVGVNLTEGSNFVLPSGLSFGDGTTFPQLLNKWRPVDLSSFASVPGVAHMVRFLPSLQNTVADGVDECLVNGDGFSLVEERVPFDVVTRTRTRWNFRGEGMRSVRDFHMMSIGMYPIYLKVLELLRLSPLRKASLPIGDSHAESGALEHPLAPQRRRDSRQLTCVAAPSAPTASSVLGWPKYDIVDLQGPAQGRSSAAFLEQRVVFHPEISSSPLVEPEINSRSFGAAKEALAARHARLKRDLETSQCRIETHNKSVVLLSTVRDEPKRALDFVAYHLLLGVDKIVLLDVGTDTVIRTSSADDYIPREGKMRSNIPSLHSYLHPFVEYGLVEIVALSSLPAMWGSSDSGAVPDAASVPSIAAAFFKKHGDQLAAAKRLEDSDEHGGDVFDCVLLLRDVSEMLVLTSTPHVRGGDQPYSCIQDFLPLCADSKKSIFIPKVEINAANNYYDFRRTPFEATSFATGSSTEMLSQLFLVVNSRVRSESGEASPFASGRLFLDIPMLTSTESFATQPPLSQCVLPDGLAVVVNDKDIDLRPSARYTMRVLRYLPSLQREVELAVDSCFDATPGGKKINSAGQPTRSFDIDAITAKGSIGMYDDLPEEHSLPRTGFLNLHGDLLHILQFDDASSTQASLSPLAADLQSILLRAGAVLDSKGLPLTSPEQLTNINLMRGVVTLKHEVHSSFPPRDDAARASLHSRFREFFGDDVTRSICPGRNISTPPEVNITFCTSISNRAKDAVDWILYHKALGVGTFLIVDDGSNDNLVATLEPLVALGVVKVLKASPLKRFRNIALLSPTVAAFGQCVEHELSRASVEHHTMFPWVGLLEVHEYVALTSAEFDGCLPLAIEETTNVVKKRGQHLGALALQWKVVYPHRSSVYDSSQSQLHRVNFEMGSSDGAQRIRLIARVDLVTSIRSELWLVLRHDARVVFLGGNPVDGRSEGMWTGPPHVAQSHAFLMTFEVGSLVSWLRGFLYKQYAHTHPQESKFDATFYFSMWNRVAHDRTSVDPQNDLRLVAPMQRPLQVFEQLTGKF